MTVGWQWWDVLVEPLCYLIAGGLMTIGLCRMTQLALRIR